MLSVLLDMRLPRHGSVRPVRSAFSTFTASHRGGSGPPLVCLHGFTDTWRTWELVLPALERRHEVLAPTLIGHAGGPRLDGGELSEATVLDAVEQAMDDAGFRTAHIVGNSLGGWIGLQLAVRGRALSVVAFAPAGGWALDDLSYRDTLSHFTAMQTLLKAAVPHVDEILASPEGRRRATQFIAVNHKHIPADLLAHQMRGVVACEAVQPLIDHALSAGWGLDAERIECPIRVVWGTEDALLPWPSAAARFRSDWLPHADWVVLDGVGHCPQLDVPAQATDLILGFAGT
jgi:pimeloyl-ACP methyl ester carboxylesterase